jgi:hypothetical protein
VFYYLLGGNVRFIGFKILVLLALAVLPLSAKSDLTPRRARDARWLMCEGPLDPGCRDFLAGNLTDAVERFSELSTSDNIPWSMHAAYNLGYLFELGAGVERSLPQALIHYDRAALQEIPRAQHRLALLLLTYCRGARCRPPGHDLESEASQLLERSSRVLQPPADQFSRRPGSYGEPHCRAAIAGSTRASQFPAALSSAAKNASRHLTSSIGAYREIRGGGASAAVSRETLNHLYWAARHWLSAKSELCRCLSYEKTEESSCDAFALEKEEVCSLNPNGGLRQNDIYCWSRKAR